MTFHARAYVLLVSLLVLTCCGLYWLMLESIMGTPLVNDEYWTRAIYDYKQHKAENLGSPKMIVISGTALELQRELGIRTWRSAWYLLMRLRHVLAEHEQQALRGDVEVDEAWIAPKGKGIPAKHKPMVVVAVATSPKGPRYRRWQGVRIEPCEKRTKSALHGFVRREVRPGARLIVDGLSSYRSLRSEGYRVAVIAQQGLKAAELRELDPLPHAHLAIKHLKTWIAGRFHGVTARYLSWYTRAFVYRVNRRERIAELFGRICRRLGASLPLTLRGLRALAA